MCFVLSLVIKAWVLASLSFILLILLLILLLLILIIITSVRRTNKNTILCRANEDDDEDDTDSDGTDNSGITDRKGWPKLEAPSTSVVNGLGAEGPRLAGLLL